ncbi:MAG TPA: hypothetical protein VG028_07210 [Terriglobia bacterium]|nr:hypothetical protein [Terriglobia bacterium]
MRQVVIENPVINSPFGQPKRHFKFTDEGITNEMVEARKDKAAKVSTARELRIEAVNNHGGLGRWQFIEISDPWDAENTICAMMKREAAC